MTKHMQGFATLDEWVAREALAFSLSDVELFETAVDRVMGAVGEEVELLGLGEALHGGEEILVLRNRLFQYLVEAYGYSAIAIESSFPRGHLVNEYVAGRGAASYEEIWERGFSHDMGKVEANRELVEWMREYNADPAHSVKLRFYGFDSPTESMYSDSPRQMLHFVLDYLGSVDGKRAVEYRSRMEPLLGEDAAWENPAANMDPEKSVGLSAQATELRIETEELIGELGVRRPELVEESGVERYREAVQYAVEVRQLLNYHADVARQSEQRVAKLLGIRDAIMADNLAYMVSCERGRGKVLAFAHNSHLKRGQAEWGWGSNVMTWWPAGAHMNAMFGVRYVVIGSAVGESTANGIAQPEAGTIEERLIAVPGPVRFLPTYGGQRLQAEVLEALPTRSGSVKNRSYFTLTPQSFIEFDWLVALDSVTYTRGGWSLEG